MKLLAAVAAGLAAVACALAGLPVVIAAALTGATQTGPSAAAVREIPAALLAAYQRAPACAGLPWQVIAGIGAVESRHATSGGAHLDPATGQVSPPIVGVALNGRGVAAIRVPPGGSPWHDDPVWDHATGPMQFFTATWARWGVDANGDGVASPHNAYDAIATTGRYLCGGRTRLRGTGAVEAAIARYNAGDTYRRAVLGYAHRYGLPDPGDLTGATADPSDPAAGGPVVAGDVRPVVSYARAHLGDPYVWAAAGPRAFDCSGLTMAAYRTVGIRLPHRAALQVRYGTPISWHSTPIRAGDLLFMRGSVPVQDYGHVGIATSPSTWINAPRSGETVQEGRIPFGRLQAVRRLVR